MTDFITSQISADVQDVDLVQDIGGSLLHGMSNSLSKSAKKANVYTEQTVGKDKMEDGDSVETEKIQVIIKGAMSRYFVLFFPVLFFFTSPKL